MTAAATSLLSVFFIVSGRVSPVFFQQSLGQKCHLPPVHPWAKIEFGYCHHLCVPLFGHQNAPADTHMTWSEPERQKLVQTWAQTGPNSFTSMESMERLGPNWAKTGPSLEPMPKQLRHVYISICIYIYIYVYMYIYIYINMFKPVYHKSKNLMNIFIYI